jgi:nicotinate-nucleotide--dimethylbenzimidazole phosphoribosyltransferase
MTAEVNVEMTAESTYPGIGWCQNPAKSVDLNACEAATLRQARLTKPPGALGRLEGVAIQLAGLQGRERPAVDQVHISVFAADHGIAAAGVSAFPQAVTAQMIANMAQGGAAISVLARQLGAELELIRLGTVAPVAPHPQIREATIAPSTQHLAERPAMSSMQLSAALNEGAAAVRRARAAGAELFIAGEMGIGNTTAAAALAAGLLGLPAAALVGPGTGVDRAGLARKQALIDQALRLHQDQLADPMTTLACLGGFEIAAMAGAYVACAQQGLAVLVDGFISSAAALAAVRLCPSAREWMLLAHVSAEPGHRAVIDALALQPILDLGMRLGEGSGAAVAVPLLRLACQLHAEMATFDDAHVAGRVD